MKNRIACSIATLALLVLSGGAQALPVTFTFQNPGADLPTAGNFTTGGSCIGIGISGADLCAIDNAKGFDYSKAWATVNVTASNDNMPSEGRLDAHAA